MKNYLLAGVLATLLSGCFDILLAPVIIPLDAAITSATTDQPVTVVNSSGKVLASPPATSVPSEARFTTTKRTVRCTGKGANVLGRSDKARVALSCSNRMRGEARFTKNLTAGYELYATLEGARGESIYCSGGFYASGDRQGPFLAKCQYKEEEYSDFTETSKEIFTVAERQAAVSARTAASGVFSLTLWVQGK